MADAKPSMRPPKKSEEGASAPSKDQPIIQYFGEGADKVKFNVDPKAKLIRVYANGMILTDY